MRRSATFMILALAWLVGFGSSTTAQHQVSFDREVRPLLADRCFTCHGPDEERRKKGLRLDVEASAKAEREGRAAVVPGQRARSELWRRVNARDKDQMPPKDSGLVLSAAEIECLGAWIDQGAHYSVHWALVPMAEQVVVPVLAASDHNPIDALVRTRLQHQGLAPAPSASKTRLLRRATFTLTGLPPAPEELAAFLADNDANAFAQVIDRLLASPRYGERMAADWLDAARYADTYGYQSDAYRAVWPWRDFVVDAFQRNLPFDQFLTWQLAGDLLPNPTREQILATCFNRLHRQTNEGGSVEEEFRVEYVGDRVETLGSAVLGLTLGCARCHDHKFDPIKQRDFYQLFALFDDIDESGLYSHFTDAVPTPTLLLPTEQQEKELAAAEVKVAAARLSLLGAAPSTKAAGESAALSPPALDCVAHLPLDVVDGDKVVNLAQLGKPGQLEGAPTVVAGKVGSALRFDGENSLTLRGVADFGAHDPFTIALWLKLDAINQRTVVLHRSRAWTDAGSRGYELILEDGRPSFALIHFWPGNAVRIRARASLVPGRWTHVAIASTGGGDAASLSIVIDGAASEVDVVRDCLTKTITGGGAEALVIGARFRDRGLAGGQVDDVRVYPRALTQSELKPLLDDCTFDAASVQSAMTSENSDLRAALRARAAIRDQIPEIMVMRDNCPRTAYVLARGAYDQRRQAVAPDVPASLPPWPSDAPNAAPNAAPNGAPNDAPNDAPRNRLGLARWLTDPSHPLTARVAVNRIWQMHFGVGLVRTQEDFGVQGARPTHPELLDWLARRFVASGWDVQALHRLILLSATWQQDSKADAALRERDPDNELLARGPSWKMSAEMVRDAALLTSGLLVEKRGGPPVKPYQPPGLWEEKSGASYERDVGEGSHRRSLYTFWKRTSPPPAMTLFDAPDREVCVPRRQRTSTPLQALLLMNDPQFIEAARGLAARALRAHGADVSACVRTMVRTVLSEPASEPDAEALAALWRTQAAIFSAAPAKATSLLQVGDLPIDPALDAVTWAAATMVASAIYSLDEAIVVR